MRAASSTCSRSGSMNRLTLIPAFLRRFTASRAVPKRATTSSPPSVVTSSRVSGTRQAKSGFNRKARSIISSVIPSSRFSGRSHASFTRNTSASCMCRLSPRTCTVMESAPPAFASSAASTTEGSAFGESGSRAYRACRRVATWSIFTPRRRLMPWKIDLLLGKSKSGVQSFQNTFLRIHHPIRITARTVAPQRPVRMPKGRGFPLTHPATSMESANRARGRRTIPTGL